MYNILFVLNFSNSFEGSFIRSVKALSDEIENDSGKVVYLLPEETKGSDWISGLGSKSSPVFYFKNSLTGLYKNTKTISKIIKEYKINIIHSHFADYRQHLPIAFACAGKKDIDYIVHAHREPVVRNHLYDKLAAFVTNATLYIAVSESIKNKLAINGRRAVTLLNGVDFSRLELSDPTVNKSDYKTDGFTQNILMFGHDFEEKGVDFVIKALMDYDPEHKFRLLIAVSESVDEATKAVRELCGDVPDWIKLLPARNDVATYYKLADVFILANRHEGSPYTMIECAYMGIPIIFCDVPGQNELGIPWTVKVNHDDSAGLYKAMCEIFSEDKQDSHSMGLESKQYVTEKFSLGTWVYEVMNIYSNIHRI